jgi:hypothetical protein
VLTLDQCGRVTFRETNWPSSASRVYFIILAKDQISFLFKNVLGMESRAWYMLSTHLPLSYIGSSTIKF